MSRPRPNHYPAPDGRYQPPNGRRYQLPDVRYQPPDVCYQPPPRDRVKPQTNHYDHFQPSRSQQPRYPPPQNWRPLPPHPGSRYNDIQPSALYHRYERAYDPHPRRCVSG